MVSIVDVGDIPQPEDFEALLERLFSDDIRANDEAAHNMWSALANVTWHHKDGREYGCSWRYAGSLIADMRNVGEWYMDWYMSGPDAEVAPHIREALAKEGWTPEVHK